MLALHQAALQSARQSWDCFDTFLSNSCTVPSVYGIIEYSESTHVEGEVIVTGNVCVN